MKSDGLDVVDSTGVLKGNQDIEDSCVYEPPAMNGGHALPGCAPAEKPA